MSSLIVPNELTKLEREVIAKYFKDMREAGARAEESRSFEFSLPGRPSLFVKHDDGSILAEASTQHFFYVLANGNEEAPRIPKVIDAFCSEEGYCFMVMEKIAAPTLSACGIAEEEAIDHAASAVKWLLDQMPSVPDSIFGRISSEESPVMHMFFQDNEAPVAFANSSALYKYVAKAFTRCRPSAQPSSSVMEELSTSFAAGLAIYHSDINRDNFLLDSNNKVWMIDFQHIGVLPQVFQIYAFFNISNVFGAKVGKKLGYQPSATANLLVRASNMLRMCGGATLGLDKWGDPVRVRTLPQEIIKILI